MTQSQQVMPPHELAMHITVAALEKISVNQVPDIAGSNAYGAYGKAISELYSEIYKGIMVALG